MSKQQKRWGIGILINLVLWLGSFIWYTNIQQTNVQTAAAKNKQLLGMMLMADIPFSAELVAETAAQSPVLAEIMNGKRVDFVNALPLSLGESRPWQDFGCRGDNCAHVVWYDYTSNGTINSIVNTATGQVAAVWTEVDARPMGSQFILDKAAEIAAKDAGVTAVLGDLGSPDPAMIPMSGWLADDACRQDWCVDLSYQDPTGSGRIFHIFVNLNQEKVARTFYTRGRPERSLGKPLAQGAPYQDGCAEQDGWSFCWEMTAHDGINFRDGVYNGQTIFESIKIPQIEAWYPSWPGGYRDEIGFAGSVPPFGGTQVTDLDGGIEVRQMFTEFTFWPNCVCCYRYEEVLRLFGDGRLQTEFVSHGPGCDDLSIYRPFWRIDLDLDGGDNDQAWAWQDTQWDELTAETELFPFINQVSPDGYQLATLDGDLSLRWQMERTDPLGLDEARLFVLAEKSGEGDGPLLPGPGDTFQPPRQWLDGDAPSGDDLVMWFVPLLKTKKGGPWWCMPDPEPDFTPCQAVLRADPAGELRQPTAAELAELAATPTAAAADTPIPAPTPTPRPIQGETAEEIILNAGCGVCHVIGALGEQRKVGPDLSAIGLIAEQRVETMTAVEYIRDSILAPNNYMAPECPNGPCLANIMPRDYSFRLSPDQIDTLTEYLLTLQGQPDIISQPGFSATAIPKAFPAPKMGGPAPTSSRSLLAMLILFLSLVFLLTLALLLRKPSE